jgi:hypothetical protein
VPGKHAPESPASFYLSVARAVGGALVVLGVVAVIAIAATGGGGRQPAAQTTTPPPTVSTHPTVSSTPSTTVTPTATASNLTQQNFATRIGQERSSVAQFFLRNVQLVAGYMVLFSEFPMLTDQERQVMMQAWDQKTVLNDLVYKILPDSQVVLDSNARIKKIADFMNLTVKSGFVNPKPLILEIAELSGIDPNEVIVDPKPKPPEDPKFSISIAGKDDLTNALVLATFIAHGQPPTIQQIEQAKQLIIAAGSPAAPPTPGAGGPNGPQPPAGPEGGPGAPPPAPGAPAGPGPVPPGGLNAHPDWQIASKIAQRSRDTEA